MMQCSVPDVLEEIAQEGGGWEALDALPLDALRQRYEQRTRRLFQNVRTALVRLDEGGAAWQREFEIRLERILRDAPRPEDAVVMAEQRADIAALQQQVAVLTTRQVELEAESKTLSGEKQAARREAHLAAARADKLEAAQVEQQQVLERLQTQLKTLQLQYETAQQQLTWAWTQLRQALPAQQLQALSPVAIAPAPVPLLSSAKLARISQTGTAPEAQVASTTFSAATVPGARLSPANLAPPEEPPPELRAWYTGDTFQRDVILIQALGDTGVALRSAMDRQAQAAGLSPSQRKRAFKTLTTPPPLLQAYRAQVGQRTFYLVALSELGKLAYRWYVRRAPAPQETERLLALHHNAHHAYLILETERILRDAGFEVLRYPLPLQVAALGEYRPDLEASYQDRRIYIEAERGVYKNPDQRRLKWQKAVEAGTGEVWLAIPRPYERDRVLSDVRRHISTTVKVHTLIIEPYLQGRPVPTGFEVWH